MHPVRSTFIRLAIVMWPLAATGLHAQEPINADEGFVKLFNGKNLEGWYLKIRSGDEELAGKVFVAGQDVVHVFNDHFPKEFELNTGVNATHGMMYTKRKFSRFILRFEYKWGTRTANNFAEWQYDAGCYYHVTDDRIWPRGIEYQVRFDHTKNRNHTGDFWVSGESLDWTSSADGKHFLPVKEGGLGVTGKKGELLSLPGAAFNGLNGQWNQCEVIVMAGDYAIHKLNGKVVNVGTNLSVTEGVIGFQSETAEILYRNIMIREFEKSLPLSSFIK